MNTLNLNIKRNLCMMMTYYVVVYCVILNILEKVGFFLFTTRIFDMQIYVGHIFNLSSIIVESFQVKSEINIFFLLFRVFTGILWGCMQFKKKTQRIFLLLKFYSTESMSCR